MRDRLKRFDLIIGKESGSNVINVRFDGNYSVEDLFKGLKKIHNNKDDFFKTKSSESPFYRDRRYKT